METAKLLLSAPIETREYLWYLFLLYSLLVNQLIETVIADRRFEIWKDKGKVAKKNVRSLCNQVGKENLFSDLPAHMFTSATLCVLYTFNSWFEVQKNLRFKISGKQKWLQVMEADIALSLSTDFSPEVIQARAREILAQAAMKLTAKQAQDDFFSIMSLLFIMWEREAPPLDRRAIAHLLKNSCQVNSEEEDPDALELRLERKRIEIERLEDRLKSRLPKGRDPLGERYEQSLEEAITFPDHPAFLPTDFRLKWHRTLVDRSDGQAESLALWFLNLVHYDVTTVKDFEVWEQDLPRRTANLSRHLKTLPFPLLFDSTDDLHWLREAPSGKRTSTANAPTRRRPRRCRTRKRQKKSAGRIFVRFKGKGLSHLRFGVYCGGRQQPIVDQMLVDYQAYNAIKNKDDRFSLGLSVLRSASLCWKENPQKLVKKNHWKLQNLWLKWFCAIDMPKDSPLSDAELCFSNTEFEGWFKGLYYLTLSTKLPWETHRLYLHCTYDPRLLSAEETEQVRQEKLIQMRKVLEKLETPSVEEDETLIELKEDALKKQKDREAAIKRFSTSLFRLENNPPPPRPSQVIPVRDTRVKIGVCFSMHKGVGVAVVDSRVPATQTDGLIEPLEYQDLRGLLSQPKSETLEMRSKKIREKFKHQQMEPTLPRNISYKTKSERKEARRLKTLKGRRNVLQLQLEDYRLLGRWRRARQKNLSQRGEEQKRGLYRQSNEESNLAQHINHLIAKRIVELCHRWQASSIVIPDFATLRESIECEIQAKARKLFPGDNVTLQKEYAKEIRVHAHRWNHRHLGQCIRGCAAKYGISVVTGYQPKEGTMKSKAVGICADRSDATQNGIAA
ncbi:hypothetical protein IFO70_27745 [Phormidium tenue FACHB-886]|nr:hypothetical protein [Phormidium tenue FACHB-886]